MTKKDLKTGMVVETRKGKRYLVLAELRWLIGKDSQMEYLTHKDDLTYSTYTKDLDIMKVYEPYRSSFNLMIDNPGKLLWERNEGYNGKVVCIEVNNNHDIYTLGKIYEFKDGHMINDEGEKFPSQTIKSFEAWSKWTSSKFIEVVE